MKNYLRLYLTYQDILVLASREKQEQRELTQDELLEVLQGILFQSKQDISHLTVQLQNIITISGMHKSCV